MTNCHHHDTTICVKKIEKYMCFVGQVRQNGLVYSTFSGRKCTVYHQMSFFSIFHQPTIQSHPKQKLVAPETEAVFQIEATGDDLQFHWQKECVNITDGDGYRGTNTDTLRILDVEKTHKGRYRCYVKNYVEGKHSDEALLTVSKLFITIT